MLRNVIAPFLAEPLYGGRLVNGWRMAWAFVLYRFARAMV